MLSHKPEIDVLLVRITKVRESTEMDECFKELKALLDEIENDKILQLKQAEDTKKTQKELRDKYKLSDKKIKRYSLMWFGRKRDFGSYMKDFSFEVKSMIRERFLMLAKDYDNVNPSKEFVILKQDLRYKFHIPARLQREWSKAANI